MRKNKITYDQMIDLLKSNDHKAPNHWEQIETALNLDKGISDLPTYKAPDNLWAGIEEGLEKTLPTRQTQPVGTTRPTSRSYNGLYILLASVLFFLSTLIVINFLNDNNQTDEVQYRSEIEVASLYENKMQLDNNIDEVLVYIENNSFMFTQEQLEEFNNQLAEINTALNKLLDMQDKYGIDKSTNKMMARMERDKANLLKSMISNS